MRRNSSLKRGKSRSTLSPLSASKRLRVAARTACCVEPLEARRLLTGVTVIYVDQHATGAASGADWADAYTDLQTALSQAGSGQTIEVAQGSYQPTTGTDRTATFQLIDGVEVNGGYAGVTGENPGDRNVSLYPTILSGDIGTTGDSSDNSYNVVTGSGTDSTAVLNGFTITGGNADGATASNQYGAGLINSDGSPTINNCTFTNNLASGGGAAIDNYGSSTAPQISNCTFTNNVVSNGVGGAVANATGAAALFQNCTFTANSAGAGVGGAVDDYNATTKYIQCLFIDNFSSSDGGAVETVMSTTSFTDCSFEGNTSAGADGGGAVYAANDPSLAFVNCAFVGNTAANGYGGALENDASSLSIVNCTFTANTASFAGGAVGNYDATSPATSNSIFWNDSAPTSSEIYDYGTTNPTVTYSDVDGGSAGTGNIDADPMFVRNPSPGADGVWGTADDDYGNLQLQAGSPAIDFGSNAAIPVGIRSDLVGDLRVFNGVVDMGAYEFIAPPPTAATGAATGVSSTGATLSGTVNAEGTTATDEFQYSLDPSFAPVMQTTILSGISQGFGVAVDGSGDVFVSDDSGNDGVDEIAADGTASRFFSDTTLIQGVAVDSSGDLFVSEPQVSTVKEILPDGTVQIVGSGDFNYPTGLAVDAQGDLFVADGYLGTIDEVTPSGTESIFASGFDSPSGLAVDGNGNVYVADSSYGDVRELSPQGALIQTVASGLSEPTGVGVDAAGDVFISEYRAGTVDEIPVGGAIESIGSGFGTPAGLAADAAGDVYINDTGNQQVVKLSPQAAAGTPSSVTGDGDTAISATLSGLVPDSTYFYRPVGFGPGGTAVGASSSFTTLLTPPTVTTGSPIVVGAGAGASSEDADGNESLAAIDTGHGITLAAGTYEASSFDFTVVQAGDVEPALFVLSSGTIGSGTEVYTAIAVGDDYPVTVAGVTNTFPFSTNSADATFTVPAGGETVYEGFSAVSGPNPVGFGGDVGGSPVDVSFAPGGSLTVGENAYVDGSATGSAPYLGGAGSSSTSELTRNYALDINLTPLTTANANTVAGPGAGSSAPDADTGGTRLNIDTAHGISLAAGTYQATAFDFTAAQAGDVEPALFVLSSGTIGSGDEVFTAVAVGDDTSVTSTGSSTGPFSANPADSTFVVPAGGETVYEGFSNLVGPNPVGFGAEAAGQTLGVQTNPGGPISVGESAYISPDAEVSGPHFGGAGADTYEETRAYAADIQIQPVTTATSATLTGVINAQGGIVNAEFQYSTDSTFTQTVQTAAAAPASITDSTDTPVSATITDLAPGTTYFYRAVATSDGPDVDGTPGTFTTAAASTVVTNTADSGDGSLRQAILNANTLGSATITFDIPTTDPGYDNDANVFTITPVSQLPTITGEVTINGYSQPGASVNTLATGDNAVINIAVNGSEQGEDATTLDLEGGNSTVEGLDLEFSGGDAIDIGGVGGDTIQGNFIGTDTTGNSAAGNTGVGVFVQSSANTIGGGTPDARNVISGNQDAALRLSGSGAENNLVEGNYLGVTASGNAALGNLWGVIIDNGADNNFVGTDGDGTNDATEGNVISANTMANISVQSADSNVVAGNFIGTDAAGTTALGGGIGVWVSSGSQNTLIGTNADGVSDADERNIISGNTGNGVLIDDGSNDTIVAGNYIGTDVTGTNALPNTSNGVSVVGPVSGATIGTQLNPTKRYNGTYAPNIIAYNDQAGVGLVNGPGEDQIPTGVSILGNSILGNTGLGIDLGDDGVTPNDSAGHTGPNNYMDFPVITSATVGPDGLTVTGTDPEDAQEIQIFSDTSSDPTGYGQGETYLPADSGTITTNAAGTTFSETFAGSSFAPYVSAVATDSNGDSSEFSADAAVQTKSSPTITTTPGGAVALASGGKLSDSATISGGNDPGGTITFTLLNSSNATVYTNVVAISDNGTYNTSAGTNAGGYLPMATGTYQWEASYSGDTNNNAVSSNSGDEPETVTAASPTISTTPGGTIVLGSGNRLTDSATLGGGYNETGTITFKLLNSSNATVYTDVVTVSGNGTYTTTAGNNPGGYLPTVSGTYQWTASYSGDTNNTVVSTGSEPQSVSKSRASITATPGGTIVFGSGSKLTASATLSGYNPTGTITFTLLNPSNATVYTDVVTVNGNGSYTTSAGNNSGGYVPAAAGSYQWTAAYSGDSNNGSVSSTGTEAVTKATPTVTWVAPANIGYGTPLTATQLNATSTLPGTFVYTPFLGTYLRVGANQTLSVVFTPTDTTDYNVVTSTTLITVTAANVLTVNTTADSGPGSLRQAIINADNSSTAETIQFAIPGSGVQTISPLSPLPAITTSTIINGKTQPNSASSPLIDINGATYQVIGNGLTLASGSSSSTIEGLTINGFSVAQISIAAGSNGDIIEGNYIGTNSAGTAAAVLNTTAAGILIASSTNIIGGSSAAMRNVISGNQIGVEIASGSNNLIEENYIGTDATGLLGVGNTLAGVDILDAASNNTIGGSSAATSNTIAFNGAGVIIGDAGTTTVPVGNAVLWNSIFSNTGLGISLGSGGANHSITAPTISGITTTGPLTTISVLATPGSTVHLELYTSPTAAAGQGKQLLIGLTEKVPATGIITARITALTGTQFITATLTDATNDTSAFSAPVRVN